MEKLHEVKHDLIWNQFIANPEQPQELEKQKIAQDLPFGVLIQVIVDEKLEGENRKDLQEKVYVLDVVLSDQLQ